ncbi:DUF2062 domain-containing protein [Desulforhopalus singaporensis]|uniref:DUF2062 domain-containing protein n=1 Tax=Desulforhopalus singaporensis TaxID=91360 RepID=A0A1H0QLR0_9BACT|nr:DUF2062 domain-containing protein [Desulforhopalus singaporensis]SDP17985.1 hypothetical protein SAMN05660330_02012 [Desulforhopalus singaporensis]
MMSARNSRLYRTLKYFYLKFIRLKGSPKVLAGGTAIGVLVGLSPTVPLHTPLILVLTVLTKTSSVAAILVSLVVFNPVTIFPIYYCSIAIGNLVTPYKVNYATLEIIRTLHSEGLGLTGLLHELASLGFETLVVLVVGGFIFSLPFAVLSYYCSLSYFHNSKALPKKRG